MVNDISQIDKMAPWILQVSNSGPFYFIYGR